MTNDPSHHDGHNEEPCRPTQSADSASPQSADSVSARSAESVSTQSTDFAAKRISRRQFGRSAAGAVAAATTIAAATTLAAPALLASNVAGAQKTPAPNPQQKQPEPLEGLTPEQAAEVDARLANILRKYGSRFTEDQKSRLRRILVQNERMMAPVRAFALENGDAPASVLRISFDHPRSAPEKEGR